MKQVVAGPHKNGKKGLEIGLPARLHRFKRPSVFFKLTARKTCQPRWQFSFLRPKIAHVQKTWRIFAHAEEKYKDVSYNPTSYNWAS